MQTASAAFVTSVLNPDQMIATKVLVTFPGGVQASFGDLSDCLESLEFNRQITSTLPDGTTQIAGYSSVQPELTLAGLLNQGDGVAKIEGQTVYWLFNPNDPSSPMYRKSRLQLQIVIQMGLYDGEAAPELITQFTGVIDQITCSDGEVTLTCLDRRATVTNQAALPPVFTQAPYNAGLTSEFAMDYLARHASPAQYYSWIPPVPDCVCAVGFRSSIWPEVGTLVSNFAQFPLFTPGTYGTALAHSGFGNVYEFSAPIVPSSPTCVTVTSAGSDFDISINDDAATYQVFFFYAGSTLFVFTVSPSGESTGASWSLSAGSHTLELSATWGSGSSTCSGTVWIDGVSHAFSFTTNDARPSGLNFTRCAMDGPVEGVQVSSNPSYVTQYPFTPTFIIDPAGSLNSLTALPDVSGKDTWTVWQDIVNAEAAVIGFNELGDLQFTNRQTIKTMSVARSITSSQSLMSLDSYEQMSLCATHIQAPVKPVAINPLAMIWYASAIIDVPALGSTTKIVQTSTPVLNVQTPDGGFWPIGSTANITTWRGCTTADGSGDAVTSGITINIIQTSASLLTVTITNTNGFDVYLVQPASWADTLVPEGQAFLAINAQPVVTATASASTGDVVAADGSLVADAQWPPLSAGGAVDNPNFGEVLLPIAGSDWLQDPTSAQELVDDLLGDLFYPKPLYRNITIIPDPRLQGLDRVTLVDPDISQINDDGLLVGIDTSISSGTYAQTIDARAWNRPGSWVLDVVGRSELDSTTYIF